MFFQFLVKIYTEFKLCHCCSILGLTTNQKWFKHGHIKQISYWLTSAGAQKNAPSSPKKAKLLTLTCLFVKRKFNETHKDFSVNYPYDRPSYLGWQTPNFAGASSLAKQNFSGGLKCHDWFHINLKCNNWLREAVLLSAKWFCWQYM